MQWSPRLSRKWRMLGIVCAAFLAAPFKVIQWTFLSSFGLSCNIVLSACELLVRSGWGFRFPFGDVGVQSKWPWPRLASSASG